MIAAVRLGVGIVIRWAQSGEETGRWPAALITLSPENRRIPMAMRILLQCTCKIARTV
jgi:hypothetical protein